MKKLRTPNLARFLGCLPTLMLAGALCLSMAGPALADFESAVAAYEGGAFQAAQTEFEVLAASGDQRAEPYLERIRKRLSNEEPTDGSLTSSIGETLTSIFGGSDRPSDDSESKSTTRDAGSSTAGRSPTSTSDNTRTVPEPWSASDKTTESAPPPVSDVVTPQRRSIWSTIYHMPGDATVIGLQYVAQLLDADNLSRELQFISRHSNKIALSILAGFWWLVIIKGVVGIGVGISRFMKVATTITEKQRYG